MRIERKCANCGQVFGFDGEGSAFMRSAVARSEMLLAEHIDTCSKIKPMEQHPATKLELAAEGVDIDAVHFRQLPPRHRDFLTEAEIATRKRQSEAAKKRWAERKAK